MKIKSLSIWHVPLTSHETYYMADGKTCDTVETVVVRVDTDDGRSGWAKLVQSHIIFQPMRVELRRPWPNLHQ